MNTERIKVLTNIYLARFPELTGGDADIRDKWSAVSGCARKWDLNAADFRKMFAEAFKNAVFLTDHDDVHPVEGILYLCKEGRGEDVRAAFADLLLRDGGDIADRQERASAFVRRINDMLEELAPEKWQYRQKIRTAIKYLAIIRPADNYIFKASAAAAFAGYCGNDEEIGYDKYLKLSNYYHMCDETATYLRTRNDLLEKLTGSLEEKAKKDGDRDLPYIDVNLHVLTYDLISTAYRCNFYADKAANRRSKVSTVQQRKIDRAMQKARLIDQREDCVDKYEEYEAAQRRMKIPQLIGKKARHGAFGNGMVELQEGPYITVSFADRNRKFVLPGAVTQGYLSFAGKKIEDSCADLQKALNDRKMKEEELTSIDVRLQLLD